MIAVDVPTDQFEAALSAGARSLPAISQQKGYKGILFLADRGKGKGFSISLWETEEDCRASMEQAAKTAKDVAMATGSSGNPQTAEVLEVAASDGLFG
jgi:heme-degrading monooxygenase HmoA